MKAWLLTLCLSLKFTGIAIVWMTDFALLGWLVFLAGGFLVVAHLVAPNLHGVCEAVSHFTPDNGQRAVWLTIDDGPDPFDTPKILGLLQEFNATATFFLIGQRAEQHPELVQAIREAGHEVGCHTYSHPTRWFWSMGATGVAAEIDRGLATLGGDTTLFRSPVGIKNFFLRRILRERGLEYLGWSVRSGDGLRKNLDAITGTVRRRIFPGCIILMHEGPGVAPGVRVAAIRRVLDEATAQGYRFIRPALPEAEPAQLSPTPLTTTKEPLCN